jgi:hypothetical protein
MIEKFKTQLDGLVSSNFVGIPDIEETDLAVSDYHAEA